LFGSTRLKAVRKTLGEETFSDLADSFAQGKFPHVDLSHFKDEILKLAKSK
jgi:hypothetical protein